MIRLASRLVIVVFVLALGAVALVPAARRTVLTGVGQHLSAADVPGAADLLAMDVESGFAGAIKVGDLYRDHKAAAVGVLVPKQTALDDALRSRRIVLPDTMTDVLTQLGIPKHAVVQIPAGEGGTTETTEALAAWSRANPTGRVIVVVGPSHGRRYRRTLRRVWPAGHPEPRVVTTQYALFRAGDWWTSRTTLREGLVEVQKLFLDYLLHPAGGA
jgi:hypothetical protein